jgi:hypothetical protein
MVISGEKVAAALDVGMPRSGLSDWWGLLHFGSPLARQRWD